MAEPRHPERFDHVFAPWPYDRRLAVTLAARVARGASQGLDTIRREALQPGRAFNVIVGLIAVDRAWVRENSRARQMRSYQSYGSISPSHLSGG